MTYLFCSFINSLLSHLCTEHEACGGLSKYIKVYLWWWWKKWTWTILCGFAGIAFASPTYSIIPSLIYLQGGDKHRIKFFYLYFTFLATVFLVPCFIVYKHLSLGISGIELLCEMLRHQTWNLPHLNFGQQSSSVEGSGIFTKFSEHSSCGWQFSLTHFFFRMVQHPELTSSYCSPSISVSPVALRGGQSTHSV